MTHELKIWTTYFDRVWDGSKNFEIRRDDREPRFDEGDAVRLREWSPDKATITDGAVSGYTGREALVAITYVARNVTDFGLAAGHCVFGFKLIKRVGYGGKENWL